MTVHVVNRGDQDMIRSIHKAYHRERSTMALARAFRVSKSTIIAVLNNGVRTYGPIHSKD